MKHQKALKLQVDSVQTFEARVAPMTCENGINYQCDNWNEPAAKVTSVAYF